jgi:hypothetical protein
VHGKKPGKYLSNQIKKKIGKGIQALRNPNVPNAPYTTNSKEMANIFKAFYEKMQTDGDILEQDKMKGRSKNLWKIM